jgi:hypothetical protein
MGDIERRLLIGVSRDEMRVQRGLHVAEHRIVDPNRAGLGEQGVAERSHIRKKLRSSEWIEIIQMGYDRIG